MKKIFILGMAALAVTGFTSCDPDTDPKISTATEFMLNTPPLADQTLELTEDGTYTFTVSQPNYGLTLAPTYGIQVSLKEDFSAIADGTYVNADDEEVQIPAYCVIPLESQMQAVLTVKQNLLAAAMCALRGIGSEADYTQEGPRPLYIRATAIVADHESTAITSNVIALKNVVGYSAFVHTGFDDVLYTPGNANGWSFDNAMMLPITEEEGVYAGYMVIDGGFKFTHGASWASPGNYGMGDTNLAEDGDGNWTGTLVENGGNCEGPEPGLYYATVTITNYAAPDGEEVGTVSLSPIKSIGIIGNFNGWGGDVEMTPQAGFTTWKAENVDLGDGGWKFRMNADWKYNLGGSLKNLTQDGDNLSEGGVHTVIIDFSTLPYSARLE